MPNDVSVLILFYKSVKEIMVNGLLTNVENHRKGDLLWPTFGTGKRHGYVDP